MGPPADLAVEFCCAENRPENIRTLEFGWYNMRLCCRREPGFARNRYTVLLPNDKSIVVVVRFAYCFPTLSIKDALTSCYLAAEQQLNDT